MFRCANLQVAKLVHFLSFALYFDRILSTKFFKMTIPHINRMYDSVLLALLNYICTCITLQIIKRWVTDGKITHFQDVLDNCASKVSSKVQRFKHHCHLGLCFLSICRWMKNYLYMLQFNCANNTEIHFKISSNLIISNSIRNNYMHFRSKET